MKTAQRVWWLILSIGITVLGLLFLSDGSGIVPGIAAVAVGAPCTIAMLYILFGKKQ
jgi:hypothetical protein